MEAAIGERHSGVGDFKTEFFISILLQFPHFKRKSLLYIICVRFSHQIYSFCENNFLIYQNDRRDFLYLQRNDISLTTV